MVFQVGSVKSFIKEDEELENRSERSVKAKIFQIENQPILLVPFNEEIKDEEAATYTKSLIREFPDNIDRILLLDSFTTTGYISETWGEDFTPPLLRVLQTSIAPTIKKLPTFEIPNMVKGLSASILNYCEIYSIPCYSLLSLQEYLYGKLLVTNETLEAYQQGLSQLGLENLLFDEKLMEQTLETQYSGRVDDNHHRLYM
ncbi:hypothetical protein BDF20DRAFT_394130 [Mycotypha africana]|uniref:uncharacterized protein n=1 Tax=Mycotypha africana TaxID=64632 RepID=UPI0023018AFA|nr:uncharacterized protein BDF20DRAFT_394130 [Mycotypha africana]KAI8984526.1 hypothetical protein BDF20DRAFT_394130 [Mycotypha africana]